MAPAGTHIEANGLRIYYEVHGEVEYKNAIVYGGGGSVGGAILD